MPRYMNAADVPVFRVLVEDTIEDEKGIRGSTAAYGPYSSKGVATAQKSRMLRAHKDYGRPGTRTARVQTATPSWTDVE